jgi:two-component system sensor histidine kinase KdpD
VAAVVCVRHHCGVAVLRQRSTLGGIAAVLVTVAAITVANYGLRELVPVVATGMAYLLAVLLVSSRWGLWMGVLAAIVSAGAWNYFHIPPTGGFTVADGENWLALVVFLAVAAVTSTFAGQARARAAEAESRRREADLSAEMARLLLGVTEVDEALRLVGQRIAQAFDLASVAVELSWRDSDRRLRALPLVVDGSRVGTVLVPRATDAATLDLLQDRVVPSLETLVSAARRRDELETQVIETKALRRANVVKTALLRSVSHDLRSPLTAITTAAGGLGSETLSDADRRELVAVIADEAARLSKLVDNLLDLSRLQGGGAEPRRDWCSIDEVVRAALEDVAAPPDGFELHVEADVPLVEADAAQIERALANVVENALRHGAGAPVTVNVRRMGPQVGIRVADRGPGIPREDLERIFEPFHGSGEHAGAGLGLAIARGFVEANGGRIRAESLPGQGTTITIQLPAPAAKPVEVS